MKNIERLEKFRLRPNRGVKKSLTKKRKYSVMDALKVAGIKDVMFSVLTLVTALRRMRKRLRAYGGIEYYRYRKPLTTKSKRLQFIVTDLHEDDNVGRLRSEMADVCLGFFF